MSKDEGEQIVSIKIKWGGKEKAFDVHIPADVPPEQLDRAVLSAARSFKVHVEAYDITGREPSPGLLEHRRRRPRA